MELWESKKKRYIAFTNFTKACSFIWYGESDVNDLMRLSHTTSVYTWEILIFIIDACK